MRVELLVCLIIFASWEACWLPSAEVLQLSGYGTAKQAGPVINIKGLLIHIVYSSLSNAPILCTCH